MSESEQIEMEALTRQMHAEAKRILESRPRKFDIDHLRKERPRLADDGIGDVI
jgi:hypothetical protein